MSLAHCYTVEDEEYEKMIQKKQKREFPKPSNIFSVSQRTTLDLSKTTHRFKKVKKSPCLVDKTRTKVL
jgi:hypothetical protein